MGCRSYIQRGVFVVAFKVFLIRFTRFIFFLFLLNGYKIRVFEMVLLFLGLGGLRVGFIVEYGRNVGFRRGFL